MMFGLKIFFRIIIFIMIAYYSWLCLFSVYDFYRIYLDLNFFIAVVLSLLTAFIPIVGTILSISGAVIIWQWSITQATSFFLISYIPVFFTLILYLYAKFKAR